MPGSPLLLSVISVTDLDRSLAYYVGQLGLDAHPVEDWADSERSAGLLPPGMRARATLVGRPGSDVGRLLLVEYDTDKREFVRAEAERRFYGLFNVNFYTADISAAAKAAADSGFQLWSDPVQYLMSERAGQPTEVVYEGPDAVVVNLVEPSGEGNDPVARAGRFFRAAEKTPAGYSEVATSSHCVKDREPLAEFHTTVLGHEMVIDETMQSRETDRLLGLEAGTQTRVSFMRHPSSWYGKVVLSHPVNYRPVDLVPRTQPPNLGYLAMGFHVDDPEAAAAALVNLGGAMISPADDTDLPVLGRRPAALVATPGSGAAYLLFRAEGR